MPSPHEFTSDKEYDTSVKLAKLIVNKGADSKHSPTFAITGIVPPEALDVTRVALYVTRQQQPDAAEQAKDDSTSNVARYALPLSDEDVNRVYEAGLPSSHGKGNETVYDPSYRQARELKVRLFSRLDSCEAILIDSKHCQYSLLISPSLPICSKRRTS
jgi:hypothetical protein